MGTEVRSELNRVIEDLNAPKHQRLGSRSCDARRLLERLGNACKDAFRGWEFGYFEDVVKVGFQLRFKGTFRIAEGAGACARRRSARTVTLVSESNDLASMVDESIGERLKAARFRECLFIDPERVEPKR